MAQPDMDDLDFQLDSDSEEEQEAEEQQQARRRAGAARDRIPLHHFLRLIAPHRLVEHGAAATNDDLVVNLKRTGALTSDRVGQAMRVCARDLFVVEQYRDEALIDAPIRVEEMDFNISAPHMHATCLEALQLQLGHKVLDVGSGCGVLTAACAYLVGKLGCVVGVDIRRDCVRLCRDNVRRLASTSAEYASTAAPIRFEQHNVFMPSAAHRGQYDRVHVGASCPPDRLQPLVALLRPEGGIIVVPVSPNDLRVITKKPNGAVAQKVVSQVRFSDLEVPTDAQVLLATLKQERKARTAPQHVPSTYAADMASVAGGSGLTPSSSYSESCSFMPSSSPTAVLDGLPPTPDCSKGHPPSWPSRISKLLTSCGGSKSSVSLSSAGAGVEGGRGGGPEAMAVDEGGTLSSPPSSPTIFKLSPEDLGEPDCQLVGAGWQLPVHRSVMRARCDHFRARCDSGMRDADSAMCLVPDHFSRESVEALLHYAYHDEMPQGLDPQAAVGLLHVAQYYGVPRLTHLCEMMLGRVLKGAAKKSSRQKHRGGGGGSGGRSRSRAGQESQEGSEEEGEDDGLADAAAALLALADDCGLGHLRAVALDYIVAHFDEVSGTESYAALTRHQVDMVASEAARLYAHMTSVLRDMATTQSMPLPERTY